jgi:colanic acid biosynthesis glycosyl transferase WcaI
MCEMTQGKGLHIASSDTATLNDHAHLKFQLPQPDNAFSVGASDLSAAVASPSFYRSTPDALRAPAVAGPRLPMALPPGPRRILLYGLNFAPEQTGIGKYTGEMAQWLANAGHDVRVITTPPYYPDWSVGAGYNGWKYSTETWNGVRVDRAPLWVPKKPGGKKRLLHLASFAASSLPLLMKSFAWRPHLVWTVAPALACAPGAALFARLTGALSWLHVQDFEVDAAFEMGMLRGDKMRARAGSTERNLMRSFDRVSSISHRMVAKLADKGVTTDRAVFFPNWVDTDAIQPRFTANAYRQMLGIPEGAFVALYSGTMGAKQGLEVLAEAAHLLARNKHIHFLFCGQGVGREPLQSACASLPNVHWLPLQPAEQLSELLNIADLHLLPQQRVASGLMMPSKLTGMLASGRPVLATADPDTELAAWVDGCGRLVSPGDGAALAHAVTLMSQNPAHCRHLGEQARRRAVKHLSRDSVLQGFHWQMESALAARAS